MSLKLWAYLLKCDINEGERIFAFKETWQGVGKPGFPESTESNDFLGTDSIGFLTTLHHHHHLRLFDQARKTVTLLKGLNSKNSWLGPKGHIEDASMEE